MPTEHATPSTHTSVLARKTECPHCRAALSNDDATNEQGDRFCCHGCRTAHEITQVCSTRDRSALLEQPARPSPFEEMDDPAFTTLYVRSRDDGLRSIELLIEGVHCVGCVGTLESLPRLLPGVVESALNFRQSTLRVLFEPARVSVSQIARTIDAMGYTPHPSRGRTHERTHQIEERRELVRIGVAGVCAGNVMIFAFALYGGVFGGIQPQFQTLFRVLCAAFGTLALAWPGRVFFRSAWGAMHARHVNLDVPICIALAGGGLMGLVNTILDRGEIYFDSVTAIVFLLLIGRFVQHRQQRRAAVAVELLFSMIPSRVRRVERDSVRVVPAETLQQGDLVEILAGDTIPIDGVIEHGSSSIDESLLTGESTPIAAEVGSIVHAGSTNLANVLRVRAKATGRETRAGRLMNLIEESAARRPRITHFTDHVARYFVFGVLALAALTLVLWLRLDPSHAIDHATSMLIVTCPCMLGLGTPLVMATSIGHAARRGILIKGADVLEQMSTPGTLVLDKTGTVTQGRAILARASGDPAAIRTLAALESKSSHHLARAIVQGVTHADSPTTELGTVTAFSQTIGAGVTGVVDGHTIVAGSRDYLIATGVTIDDESARFALAAARDGLSPVLVGIDGHVRAALAVGDPIRDDARDAIHTLKRAGWKIELLSGDHPDAVRCVGRSLGIEDASCKGGVSPEEKLAHIETLEHSSTAAKPIVMVGDGVNDAAALAAASVGIAVHGGSEASLSAADVYLSRPGLTPILETIAGSRRAMRTIRMTLWASLVYNVIAAGFTLAGQIAPWIAAILMPLNSLTVTLIAVRTAAFRKGITPAQDTRP